MFSFIRKPYFIAFIILYLGSIFVLYKNGFPSVRILVSFFSFALVLPLLAYYVSVKAKKAVDSQAFFYREWFTLGCLIVYMIIYISWGDHFADRHILSSLSSYPLTGYLLGVLKVILFMFLIPFLVYKIAYRFTLAEAGLAIPLSKIFSLPNIIIFFSLSAVILLFQYLFNEELELLWEGDFDRSVLITGIPVLFLLLLLKSGLSYGFFFRSIMQSRFSIGINSKFGGLLISLLIFGLAHTTMLMTWGIPDRHQVGQFPGLLVTLSYCIGILSITALFIAIIWRRTKNLWLVMGLYAVVDLLPALHGFLLIWK